jgi:hypothetical protein
MTKEVVVWMSDKAFTRLVGMGRESGYIRGKRSAKGITNYLTALVKANASKEDWEDCRPAFAKDEVVTDLEMGFIPAWTDGDYRRQRGMTVAPETVLIVKELAKELGIIRQGPALRVFKPLAVFSEFWEAVGIGWLKPKVKPVDPVFKQPLRKEKYQFEW